MNTIKNRNCFSVKESDLSGIRQNLTSTKNIVVVSHQNPDGDAVGSALGLALTLNRAGHTANVVLPDDVPGFLKWMPGFSLVTVFEKNKIKSGELIKNADILFFVDMNAAERVGEMTGLLTSFRGIGVQLDHHPGTGGFSDFSVISEPCGSTAEMVFYLLEALEMKHTLDEQSATCLLAGIITDTLGFSVASAYSGIFRVVMELMDLGADKDRVFQEVYHQYSLGRLRLLGFSLASRMKVYDTHRAACIYLSKDDMNQFNYNKGDTEGFVNYPLTIKGIDLSVFFTEQDDHIKLSLRSRGGVDANAIAARHFQGGGHTNAAGGKFFGTMDEALKYYEKIIQELER